MNNHRRELLALRYLSALENRDLETLADILKQAETDAALDGMIREIHAEEQHRPIGVASPGMNGRTAVRHYEEKKTMTTLTLEKRRIAFPWTQAATFAVVVAVGLLLAFFASNSGGPNADPQQGLMMQPTSTPAPADSDITVSPIEVKLGDEYRQASTLTLPIETEKVNLEVESWVGKVEVVASAEPVDAITVQVTKRVTLASEDGVQDLLDAIKVTAERDGDVYRVASTYDLALDQELLDSLSAIQSVDDLSALADLLCCDKVGFPSVDLLITVPPAVNVKINAQVGEIAVTGIAAPEQVDIESQVGSITVDSVTTPGAMTVTTEVGEIVARNSAASGSMTINVETGRIAFDGVIAGQGDYQLDTAIGEIDVTVRDGSAFPLDAVTETGDVAVELDGADVDVQREVVKVTATGSYNPAQADLQGITFTAHCDMGSIRLHD
jgi:hypothetical protein